MKVAIASALKARFVGVSDSILNRIADRLARTVTREEDVQAAVEAVTLQQVIDSEADRRATEATQTAVANYEKKHSLREGKPVVGGGQVQQTEPGGEPEQGGNFAAQLEAAVRAAVSPLVQEIETLKSGKVADYRRQQLEAAVSSASEKFRGHIERSYGRMTFKDDADFTGWLEEVRRDAEEDAAEVKAQGAVFGRPKAGHPGNGKDDVPAAIMDFLDGKGKAEGQPF